MIKKLSRFLLIVFALVTSIAWDKPNSVDFEAEMEKWVDSVYNSMSEEERIGQLFMVAAYSNKGEDHVEEIEELVQKHNIGGLIFFQGGPVRQAQLTNHYQDLASVPLFVAMDAEWGLPMRLDSTVLYPKQMTLGAIEDEELVYKMGEELANQLKRLGVHINFAPVVDVNSNPKNPVIGIRSFGEDKENVAGKAIAYMRGMQDNGIIANAKHFPGHGDTGSDSHLTLPVIRHDLERLKDIEMYPFRELSDAGVMSMMVGHIHVPALDDEKNKATTLSRNVVTDLLKEDIGFEGLVFTDALNMKGVADYYKPGEVDLLALQAGNDVLLYPEDVPAAVNKIEKALRKGDVPALQFEKSVKKILSAKYWAGLHNEQHVVQEGLVDALNSSEAKAIQQRLYEEALTVVKNERDMIPVRVLDTASFASVSVGLTEEDNQFQSMLGKYVNFTHFNIKKDASEAEFSRVLQKLRDYEVVVVGVHDINPWKSSDYGITQNSVDFVKKINQQNSNSIVSVFGSPYSLKFFKDSPNLIMAYEDNEVTRKIVPQLIFGGIGANGRLPVTIEGAFEKGTGEVIHDELLRLRYGFPEDVHMDSRTLAHIDTIAYQAMHDEATPGMQIIVAKDGNVIYNKNFGYLTYERAQPVTDTTIYDLASVTKVAGTLQAVMFLYERGMIELDEKASAYLPELRGTNKEDLVIRDILTHQAGLIPFIPHWKRTVTDNGFNREFYSVELSNQTPNMVCQGVYSINTIEDSLWQWTIESEMLDKGRDGAYEYVYSDLGFYIMQKVVERQLGQPIEDFLDHNFYEPLGLNTFGYNPLNKFSADRIAPTENDIYFRKTQVRGTVHDQGAAMMGGVGGHAGLFGTANDLAVLMQMNLQKGYYGGTRYLLPETVPAFAENQFEKNRRGLGFDKPEPEGHGPTSDLASMSTFGHTGFTGTSAWVDPDHNLVYIFISNRVYPDCGNRKLITNNVRTDIQDVIYRSILNYSYQVSAQ